MHQCDVGWVIQSRAFRNQTHLCKNALSAFVSLLRQKNLMAFFIQRKVAGFGNTLTSTWVSLPLLSHQSRHSLIDRHVHRRVVLSLAANDQRRSRFIDQN